MATEKKKPTDLKNVAKRARAKLENISSPTPELEIHTVELPPQAKVKNNKSSKGAKNDKEKTGKKEPKKKPGKKGTGTRAKPPTEENKNRLPTERINGKTSLERNKSSGKRGLDLSLILPPWWRGE